MTSTTLQYHRLVKELGIPAFFKRLITLHVSKVAGVLVFVVGMEAPGGLGWAFTTGLVVFSMCLGPGRKLQQGAVQKEQFWLVACIAAAELATACWLLLEYLVCVPWIQTVIAEYSCASEWLNWLGLELSSGSDGDEGEVESIEGMLRMKGLLLIALALKMRSLSWQYKLPQVGLTEIQLRLQKRFISPMLSDHHNIMLSNKEFIF